MASGCPALGPDCREAQFVTRPPLYTAKKQIPKELKKRKGRRKGACLRADAENKNTNNSFVRRQASRNASWCNQPKHTLLAPCPLVKLRLALACLMQSKVSRPWVGSAWNVIALLVGQWCRSGTVQQAKSSEGILGKRRSACDAREGVRGGLKGGLRKRLGGKSAGKLDKASAGWTMMPRWGCATSEEFGR